jgi:hypothetical protein
VTLRKVPGALALGLLASLVAHAALFGGDHTMGGAYHALLLQVALAGGLSLLIFFGSVAWSARDPADGSILAARLRERLPSLSAVLAAAAAWYGLAESLEPAHAAASPILLVVALGLAAWLVRRAARSIAEAFAAAVLAILRTSFSPRTPAWNRRRKRSFVLQIVRPECRRFARPPPIASAHPA